MSISEFFVRFSSFDFFFSLEYWVLFLVILLVFRLLARRTRLSLGILLGANLGMILALPRLTIGGLGVLLIFALACFLVGKGLNSRSNDNPRRSSVWITAGTVLGAVLVLAFFKYEGFQKLILAPPRGGIPQATDFIFLVGISYTAFRLIHFVLEGYGRRLAQPRLLVFLNYVFFFPGFVSGPINRYNHFAEQLGNDGRLLTSDAAPSEQSGGADDSVRLVSSEVSQGVYRIMHGTFKKVVLAALIYPYTLSAVFVPTGMEFWPLVLGIYAQTFYFYIDFSGYSDIAIGTARLLGFELPENFRSPFLKRNIQQLWANWHISLTSWLTDYVYWPLARYLRRSQLLQRRPVVLSNIAIIVTFGVCGIWHGEGINFLLWGLYHGVGIALLNAYRTRKRKVRTPWLLSYFRSGFSAAVGVVATFNFFALGIVLFSLNLSQLSQFLGSLI